MLSPHIDEKGMPAMASLSEQANALRVYLRDPAQRVTDADPPIHHIAALRGIWEQALLLAGGDPERALLLCLRAVRTVAHADESEEQFAARLAGIPAYTFGTARPYAGNDKVSHFFACALIAHTVATRAPFGVAAAGEWAGKAVGRFKEVADAVLNVAYDLGDNTSEVIAELTRERIELPKLPRITHGGYDVGDVAADDLGAAFGAALAAVLAAANGAPSSVDIADYTVQAVAPSHTEANRRE
jgi:hypothetical protein